MSGEVDYRRYAGRPSPVPHYFSDQLGSFYGGWAGTGALAISYTGGPSEGMGVVSDVVTGNGQILSFVFNARQNLVGDYALDMWYRCSTPDPRVYFIVRDVINQQLHTNVNADGATPTNWTRVVIPLSTMPNRIATERSRYLILNRALQLWVGYTDIVAFPVTAYLAGFHLRRL